MAGRQERVASAVAAGAAGVTAVFAGDLLDAALLLLVAFATDDFLTTFRLLGLVISVAGVAAAAPLAAFLTLAQRFF